MADAGDEHTVMLATDGSIWGFGNNQVRSAAVMPRIFVPTFCCRMANLELL